MLGSVGAERMPIAVIRKRAEQRSPAFQHDIPAPRLLAIMRRVDAAVELNIATQVELVGDIIR